MKHKDKNIRTEAAMKRAYKRWQKERGICFVASIDLTEKDVLICAYESGSDALIAVAPLKWFWTKRKPLRGVVKKLKKAVR